MSPSDWVCWTRRQLHTEWWMEVVLGNGRQEWAEEAADPQCSSDGGLRWSYVEFWSWAGPSELNQIEQWELGLCILVLASHWLYVAPCVKRLNLGQAIPCGWGQFSVKNKIVSQFPLKNVAISYICESSAGDIPGNWGIGPLALQRIWVEHHCIQSLKEKNCIMFNIHLRKSEPQFLLRHI